MFFIKLGFECLQKALREAFLLKQKQYSSFVILIVAFFCTATFFYKETLESVPKRNIRVFHVEL